MSTTAVHQYVERESGRVVTERFIGDRTVRMLYHHLREHLPTLFHALTSPRMSELLGFIHFDLDRPFVGRPEKLFGRIGCEYQECLDELHTFDTMRKVFERKIRYWEFRPMDTNPENIASPADARVIVGSLSQHSQLFIKEKFFNHRELLGEKSWWGDRFAGGDFGVFRLTPDKYHYNHSPVSGRIIDSYDIGGCHHSCNPVAVTAVSSIYSKNSRFVTIIDTDVHGGSQVGLVAMIEVAALMIGGIQQCYSRQRYDAPIPLGIGEHMEKGCPKSLFQPGSSTVILLFEPGKMDFSRDLVINSRRCDVHSRFSHEQFRSLVETDVKVRSSIGCAKTGRSLLGCEP